MLLAIDVRNTHTVVGLISGFLAGAVMKGNGGYGIVGGGGPRAIGDAGMG